MDGKGCWRDNVFIERVWRSIKYEEVSMRAYETVSVARERIGRYINFYNTCRPHSSHQARTPDVMYFASLPHSLYQAANQPTYWLPKRNDKASL
jgi:putative transposase